MAYIQCSLKQGVQQSDKDKTAVLLQASMYYVKFLKESTDVLLHCDLLQKIQRFEYTFELSWKTASKVLEMHGITSLTPRSIFRDLAKASWLDEPELWLLFLESRNEVSHMYKEEVAKTIFSRIPTFVKQCDKLISMLDRQQVVHARLLRQRRLPYILFVQTHC